MKKIRLILVAIGLGMFTQAPATAQDFYLPPIVDNVGIGNIAIGAAAQGHVERSQGRNTRGDVRGFTADAPNTLSAPVASMDFSYRYDRARTPQNLRNFVSRTPNPEARANLEHMIAAQPGIIDDIRGAIQPYGLDTHDVADAYAMWWINSWQAANKRGDTPDRGTIAMVKQQVRNAFAATPDFANTSDADRQEYAEALLLQAAILSTSYDQWKGKPDLLNRLAEAARQGAKASGLDLSLMTLTRNGFVPRTGADASEATMADEADQVSLARGEGEDSAFPSLGIAVASGLGLIAAALGATYIVRKS